MENERLIYINTVIVLKILLSFLCLSIFNEIPLNGKMIYLDSRTPFPLTIQHYPSHIQFRLHFQSLIRVHWSVMQRNKTCENSPSSVRVVWFTSFSKEQTRELRDLFSLKTSTVYTKIATSTILQSNVFFGSSQVTKWGGKTPHNSWVEHKRKNTKRKKQWLSRTWTDCAEGFRLCKMKTNEKNNSSFLTTATHYTKLVLEHIKVT